MIPHEYGGIPSLSLAWVPDAGLAAKVDSFGADKRTPSAELFPSRYYDANSGAYTRWLQSKIAGAWNRQRRCRTARFHPCPYLPFSRGTGSRCSEEWIRRGFRTWIEHWLSNQRWWVSHWTILKIQITSDEVAHENAQRHRRRQLSLSR
jgi:hypothetical protein